LADYRNQRKLTAASAAAERMNVARQKLTAMLRQSFVLDLRQYKAELWLLCAAEYDELENILASSKAIIFHAELSSSLLTIKA
jgi:hypothetical protein